MNISAIRHGFNDLVADRSKQINTLFIFNDNVSELQPKVQYKVDFVSDGNPMSLVVYLPPEFPKVKPNISVEPTFAIHPWIGDGGTVVGAPGLICFGNHSELGRVVQAIKRELEKNPPKISNPNAVQNKIQPMLVSTSHPNHTFVASYSHWNKHQRTHEHFPDVAKLSEEELKELNDHPVALKHFVKTLLTKPCGDQPDLALLQQTENSLSDLKKQITGLVDENRKTMNVVESKRATLLREIDKLNLAREELSVAKNAMKENRERFSVQNLCDLMQKSSRVDDDESEKCTQRFMAGRESVEQFLESYLKTRSSHHKKKVSVEMMNQQRSKH